MIRDVRLVEIEIHSHCNRTCSWCPNKFISRDTFIPMDETTYLKILTELRELDYSGYISYSRYNEPMYSIGCFKRRVQQASEIVPRAKLVSNTNGDYIRYGCFDGLYLDELTIMDYNCIGIEKCMDKLREAGADIDECKYPYIYAHYGIMKILYYVDWPEHAKIEDRGGSLKGVSDIRRTEICMEPTYFMGIDYNGSVMPCCHMRSDNPAHQNYILGNVKDKTLQEIYNSRKAKAIRKVTSTGKITPLQILAIGVDTKNLSYPCMYCTKSGGRYTRDNPGIEY